MPLPSVEIEATFRGPLDLLLYLVQREEIDIHDIPIARLTQAYLAELESMKDLDLDTASEFMAMASMLLELKSRMLLPSPPAEEGEEEVEDPRQGLVQALLEYKRFKDLALELERLAERRALQFPRTPSYPALPPEERGTIEEANVYDLFVAFQKMLRRLVKKPDEIVCEEPPLEVRIETLLQRVRRKDRLPFSSLFSDRPTKIEMVGYFLALLETIRLGKIRAVQAEDFSEIYLYYRIPTLESEAGYLRPRLRGGSKPPIPFRRFLSRALADLFPRVLFQEGHIRSAVRRYPFFTTRIAKKPSARAPHKGRRPICFLPLP